MSQYMVHTALMIFFKSVKMYAGLGLNPEQSAVELSRALHWVHTDRDGIS